MRTLKKTLCLVLALVMVLGLCAFNAAAFTDDASIKYDEAVGVMTAAGVLKGFEDGSFQPTSTLTRAQAATMITKMMGFDGVKGTTTFTDTQGHWGESYIAFCVAEGIVSGYGDGTFGPDDTLTGSQWAKMVICAMGYNAAAEGFAGDTWEVAVAKKVKTLKLAINIKAFDGTQPISRETACELGFQAMQGDLVEYTPGITVNGVEIPGDYKPTDGDSLLTQLGILRHTTKNDDGTTPLDPDTLGNPLSATYTSAATGKTLYTQSAVAIVTYTTYATTKGVTADLKGYKPYDADANGTPDAITPKVNGNDGTVAGGTALSDIVAAIVRDAAPGKTVSVYVNSKKEVSAIVETTETLVQIGKHDTKNETISFTKKVGDTINTTTISKDNNPYTYADLTAFAEKDYVLVQTYYDTTNTCYEVYEVIGKASTATGAITKKTAAALTVGGKALTIGCNADTSVTGASVSATTEVTAYLDSLGTALYIPDVVNVPKYALVIGATNSKTLDGTTYTARLLLSDGTTEDVVVSKVNGTAIATDLTAEHIVEYTVDSTGKYEVYDRTATPGTGNTSVALAANTKITKGDTAIKVANTNLKASATTIFFVQTVSNSVPSYKVYIGINNMVTIPDGTNKSTTYRASSSSNPYETAVYIQDATVDTSSTSKNVIYVTDIGKLAVDDIIDGKAVSYVTHNAVINGEITTIDLDSTTSTALTNPAIWTGVTKDTNGIVTAAAAMTASGTITHYAAKVTGTQAYDPYSGVIVVDTQGTATHLSYNEDTVVYFINGTTGVITEGAVSDIETDNNDEIAYYCTNNVLSVLFIEVK